ncbi:MAG: 2-oxoacid:acceptor oxidoreductase subunit alpha, partial [Planctomycetota bacterium]
WATEPFPYPEQPIHRGKVLGEEELAGLEAGGWGRYRDVDGDGIPYRTLPGTPGGRGAYFTRGSGHDSEAQYTESGAAYVDNMTRLSRKYETARAELPPPVVTTGDGKAGFGLIHFGTTRWAMEEARDVLREEHGLDPDDCRVMAMPLHAEVRAFIESHETVFVVEQNRDAQMKALLAMEYPDLAPRLRSILHYDGMPIHAGVIVDGVKERSMQEAGS